MNLKKSQMEIELQYKNSEVFGQNFFKDTLSLRSRYKDFLIKELKKIPETGEIIVKVKYDDSNFIGTSRISSSYK